MTLSILAVDDSRTMRDMVCFALGREGIETTVAEDGIHGLEVLDEIAPPDAIITDINMPRMDGFGFIDAVRSREEFRSIPILVLTTESAADMKDRARDAGATGWIVKPFVPETLIKALRMVAG